MSAMFTDAKDALDFILSGNATFTIVSKKTGQRFTYNARRPKSKDKDSDDGFRFIKMMTGSDNVTSYSYLGQVSQRQDRFGFKHGTKSKISQDSLGSHAISWVINALADGKIHSEKLEIWHEGKCGACGRKLTVPASIASGIGPECAKNRYICN